MKGVMVRVRRAAYERKGDRHNSKGDARFRGRPGMGWRTALDRGGLPALQALAAEELDSAGMTCAERPMSRPRHVDTMDARRGGAPRSRMVAFQRLRRSLMSSLAAASRPSERILSVVDISPRGLLGLRRAPGRLTHTADQSRRTTFMSLAFASQNASMCELLVSIIWVTSTSNNRNGHVTW